MSPGNRRIGTQQEKPSFVRGDDSYNATDANALCSRLARAPGGRERATEPVAPACGASRCRDWPKTEGWFLFVSATASSRPHRQNVHGAEAAERAVTVAGRPERRPRFWVSRSSMECSGTVSNTDGTILDPRNGTLSRADAPQPRRLKRWSGVSEHRITGPGSDLGPAARLRLCETRSFGRHLLRWDHARPLRSGSDSSALHRSATQKRRLSPPAAPIRIGWNKAAA